MVYISRSVSNYSVPFDHLNQETEHTIRCKKSDLYRCAVTVGNPSFISRQKIRDYGFWPVLCNSLIDKCSLVATNLINSRGRLRRSNIYDTYVTDKKRDVSYNLGMVFAKLHSEKLLGIRNLVHLEFLKQQNNVTFIRQATSKRPKEPDLIGQDGRGVWHIFEAKGTSCETQIASQIKKGKNQAKQINTIHGQLPGTRSVAATYVGNDRIFTQIEDPSDIGDITIDLDKIDFIKSYYAPFLMNQVDGFPNLESRIIDGIPVEIFKIKNNIGVLHVGIVSYISQLIRDSDEVNLFQTLSILPDISDRGGEYYSFGSDGFVVGFTPKDDD